MEELKRRVSRLEDFVGGPTTDDAVSLSIQNEQHMEQIAILKSAHRDWVKEFDARMRSLIEDFSEFVNTVKENFKGVDMEISVLKRALESTPSRSEGSKSSSVKVREPGCFNGARSAKELENFLWDVEQYFKAARVSETEQVTFTSMYLTGDAKLWWRTRMEDDASAGRPRIETWEALKKELKDQFLPCNTAWVARESLKKLRHTGTVRDYVKDFSSLMLDIKDMSDVDKLFNFLSGLQPWAQAELHRQGIKDLPMAMAMAAADGLVDYRVAGSPLEKKKGNNSKKSKTGGKDWKKSEGQNKKDGAKKGGGDSSNKKNKGCFLCDGPHYARDCPKKEKLGALCAEDEAEPSEAPTRMNPLQLFIAPSTEKHTQFRGLMYVMVRVNEREMRAMMDSGATNNFVSQDEADKLGFTVAKSSSKIKAYSWFGSG